VQQRKDTPRVVHGENQFGQSKNVLVSAKGGKDLLVCTKGGQDSLVCTKGGKDLLVSAAGGQERDLLASAAGGQEKEKQKKTAPIATCSFPMNTTRTSISSVLSTCIEEKKVSIFVPLYEMSTDLAHIFERIEVEQSASESVSKSQNSEAKVNENEDIVLSCNAIQNQTTRTNDAIQNKSLGQSFVVKSVPLSRPDCIVIYCEQTVDQKKHDTVMKAMCIATDDASDAHKSRCIKRLAHSTSLKELNEYATPLVNHSLRATNSYFLTSSECVEHKKRGPSKTEVTGLHPAWVEVIAWSMYDQVQRVNDTTQLVEHKHVKLDESIIIPRGKAFYTSPFILEYFNAYNPKDGSVWCIWIMPKHYSTLHSLMFWAQYDVKLQKSQSIFSFSGSIGAAKAANKEKDEEYDLAQDFENNLDEEDDDDYDFESDTSDAINDSLSVGETPEESDLLFRERHHKKNSILSLEERHQQRHQQRKKEDWALICDAISASVVFTCLAPLKKEYNLCHNDLKIDNIVYDKLDEEQCRPGSAYTHFLVYVKCLDVWLRIPTCGRIYSLIDFGYTCLQVGTHRISSHAPMRYVDMELCNKFTDAAQMAYSIMYNLKYMFDGGSALGSWDKFQCVLHDLVRRKDAPRDTSKNPIFSSWPEYIYYAVYTRVSKECGISTTESDSELRYKEWVCEMVHAYRHYVIEAKDVNNVASLFVLI